MNTATTLSFTRPILRGYVSVIIPVYKDAKGLRDTLRSLNEQTYQKTMFEIIVANDGADRDIADVCNTFGVREVAIFPRQGSYAARNAAINESKGEWIAFVDADISVPSTWLVTGTTLLKTYDYVGGAVRFKQSQLKSLTHYYEAAVAFNNSFRFKRHHYAPTANLFVRRALLETVGGFDKRFESGGDAEFGDRVHHLNSDNMLFSNDLYVYHPPRGYRALVRKIQRTMLGLRDKTQLYPERFGHLRISLLRSLLIPITPACKLFIEGSLSFTTSICILPLALWFGCVEYYYFLRVFYTGMSVKGYRG